MVNKRRTVRPELVEGQHGSTSSPLTDFIQARYERSLIDFKESNSALFQYD